MCCFSRPVKFVAGTCIFARTIEPGRQAIVYSMRLGAPEDLAMILPIPVTQPAGEDAVKFVDLSGYPDFFTDLDRGFPMVVSKAVVEQEAPSRGGGTLRVETVGAFDASFVPTVADFARLDARFRLPDDTWKRLPQYADYGFAVFQLRKGNTQVHPMAFSFPTRQPGQLFFPTVHIHDGKVHAEADFDHTLYCQTQRRGGRAILQWDESEHPADRFADVKKGLGLLAANAHIYRRGMHGDLANTDTWLPLA